MPLRNVMTLSNSILEVCNCSSFSCYSYLLECSCYWDSSSGYASTSNAFRFSLRNKEGLGPLKSMVTNPSQAIYRSSIYGPTFGGGHDIFIANNADSNTNSYSDFGETNDYSVPGEIQDPYTILAGTRYFTPDSGGGVLSRLTYSTIRTFSFSTDINKLIKTNYQTNQIN